MSTQTHVDESAFAVEYDDDVGAVVLRWKRFVTGEPFREGCEALLTVIEERNASKVLIDSREVTTVDDDDVAWMFESFVPRTIEAGVTATATVYPESTIAEMNMERIDEQAQALQDESESHMTTEMGDARSWLRQR